jgi:hypothetical protein
MGQCEGACTPRSPMQSFPPMRSWKRKITSAGVLEGYVGGLLSCLEAQPELSVEEQLEEADRQALLASLFALWKHGCAYGIEVDEIPQTLAQQATRDEQALMVQWVRQENALDEVAGSTWLNRHLADFLALLTAQ